MRDGLGEDGAVLDPVREQLALALREVVADISPDRVAKLMRRAKRITGDVVPVITGKLAGVQYLALARLTADLAERDVIAVGAESPFARATAAAAAMLQRLAAQGVYC